jgi:hypothetical protein
MLNFAEQTGSGAVIVVWSFLLSRREIMYNLMQKIYLRRSNSQRRFDLVILSDSFYLSVILMNIQVRSGRLGLLSLVLVLLVQVQYNT